MAFLLVSMIGSPFSVRSVNIDEYVAGASYLEEYQAKQRRNNLIFKGLLVLLLAAGGIIVGLKIKKKK